MDQQKKKRSENWSSEEKGILRQLISESAHIIENKSNKTATNLLKNKEWRNIKNKLNELAGKNRTENEIKLAWKRMKLAAKANISAHRQQQLQTGGGNEPEPPSQEDLSVMAIVPHDFIVETNDYDSDAIQPVACDVQIQKDALAGPNTNLNEPIIIHKVIEEVPETNSHIIQSTIEPEVIQLENDKMSPKKKLNKIKKNSQNITQTMHQDIVQSNVEFKKKQLEWMEKEHAYNIKIAQLQIKKLELEIALLQNNKQD